MSDKIDYYHSPRWSSEAPDCALPLSFDQYSNCSHNCAYCFSQYQRMLIKGKGRQDYVDHKCKSVNVESVKRLFNNERQTQYSEFIKNKMVLQWGGLSDPFCFFEKKYGVGLELLRFFKEIDYPISFSTKGTWWLDDSRYTELFKNNKKWSVKITIITTDKNKALKIERGVSTPQKRLLAIEKLKKLNCGDVVLRLRPFTFGLSDLTYKDLITQASNHGADALSTEFFCFDYRMRPENQIRLNKVVGFDCAEFYKRFSANKGCPLRLNRNVKREYVYEMRDLCKKLNMGFYVSDSHFKEMSDSGCCCGLGDGWNYSKGQFTEAAVLCRKNQIVTWPEIEKELHHFKNVKYALFNEPCERRSRFLDFTVYDYLKYLWNTPKESQSPYRLFEGIMIPFDKDTNGDLIYKYNKERE